MARHVLPLTGWIVTVCPDTVYFEVSEFTISVDGAEKTQSLTRLLRDEGAPGHSYRG